MKDQLRAIAHQAALAPQAHPGFTLSYLRGHALAGTTQFTMTAAGAYTLESNVTMGRQPLRLAGQLEPPQRDAVLKLIDDADLAATPPSTRPIGDDEEPVVITLSDGALSHRVMVWHGDAKQRPRFHAFETGLVAILARLSDGKILSSIDY